jgi:hypothetical protein
MRPCLFEGHRHVVGEKEREEVWSNVLDCVLEGKKMAGDRRVDANLAAEHFVASQLSRLGWTVKMKRPLSPSGVKTRRIDLVAELKGRNVRLDVRGLKNLTNWPIPKSFQEDTNRYLVLVCYRKRFSDPLVQPEVYVVPSHEVHKLTGPWSGRLTQRAISYREAAGTPYRDAYHLLRRTFGPAKN